MFVLELRGMFAERGIKYPFNTLLRMGIGRNTAAKMLKGEAIQIRFDHLLKLCRLLNCSPKELLKLKPAQDPNAYENSPLKDWLQTPSLILTHELQTLSPQELEQMKSYLQTLKAKKNNQP